MILSKDYSSLTKHRYVEHDTFTLMENCPYVQHSWLSHIAIENGPFIEDENDEIPIKHGDFPELRCMASYGTVPSFLDPECLYILIYRSQVEAQTPHRPPHLEQCAHRLYL